MRIQAARLSSILAFWAIYSCSGSYEVPSRRLLSLPGFRGGTVEENNEISVITRIVKNNDTDSVVGDDATDDDDTTVSEESKRKNQQRRRQRFLDRMRLVSRSLLLREQDAVLETEVENGTGAVYPDDNQAITPQSDLMRPGRHITVVTTATLPWFTGTAVNPLLRAAHLVRLTKRINKGSKTPWVTLVVPWLELEQDRALLYHNHNFSSPEDQEAFLRQWIAEEADMPDAADPKTGLRILFYPARYHTDLKSIFAMGDITSLIDDDRADVCLLEEPEHLNWFRAPGTGWAHKFHYVVGIVHTNYKDYASSQYHGLWTAPALAMISSAMVRAYCHKVIKLSDVLQTFAPEKEFTSNVHGVRSDFLKEGKRRANEGTTQRNAYFVGKVIWQKGFDIMLDLEDYYKQCTGEYFPIDIYGSGPDLKDISRAYLGRRNMQPEESSIKDVEVTASSEKTTVEVSSSEFLSSKTLRQLGKIRQSIRETTESLDFDIPKTLYELRRQPIPATFPGRQDHALLKENYTIFVNPSISEVLCTTTAEALAMGKFAIIPVHPSNTFFLKFPNCLPYRNKFEFVANLRWAMTHDPEPMTPELAREFTWEAATERLVSASAITYQEARERERLGLSKRDERIAWFHNELGKGGRGDTLRKVLGAGPVSHQVKYQKEQSDDTDDEDEEGFTGKFLGSPIAEAFRTALANGLPTLISGSA